MGNEIETSDTNSQGSRPIVSTNQDSRTDSPEAEVANQERTESVGSEPVQIDVAKADEDMTMESSSQESGTPEESLDLEMQVDNENSLGDSRNSEVTSPSSKTAISNSDVESDGSASSRSQDEEVPIKKRKKSTNGTVRIHAATLKKSGEPFVQSKSCGKLKYAVGKCMECKYKVVKKEDNECRFYSFRKLRYTERGSITVAGFPDYREYTSEDLLLWMPDKPPEGLSLELAKYLLEQVGDQFCQLVKQEKEALIFLERQSNQKLVWRKAIPNLRELCDVCSTTLFNYHWTCSKCGFAVCVSCCKARHSKNIALAQSHSGVRSNECKDAFGWLKCHLKNEHNIKELMVTQIVAGQALDDVWKKSHDVRKLLNIPRGCCESVSKGALIGCAKQTRSEDKTTNVVQTNGTTQKNSHESDQPNENEEEEGQLGIIALFPYDENDKNETNNDLINADQDGDDAVDDGEQGGILDFSSSLEDNDGQDEPESETCASGSSEPTSDNVVKADAISDVALSPSDENKEMELKNFIRREGSQIYSIKTIKKEVQLLAHTRAIYPNVNHFWLCSGFLLRLMEPTNPGNLQLFQEQWKRGQPVIVSNVSSKLNAELWSPESFSRDFGSKSNDLINCMTGKVVPGQKIKRFWDGFENVKSRLKDDNGLPMLLKLKDWPPGHDFAEMLPERFNDLMKALPLEEYTHRDGKLNLAARLPSLFSKPDLGPKMYIAYGSGLHLDKGTTNLHLDVSDAVNVMVYVGVVKDADNTEHYKGNRHS
ncbi:unnamed protein product [Orchesella dallaii]|uniref:Lysine-specific demethylase 3A n=1 Tax=Orchesella dallaii TaxID=48710 RepID=A0ABP1QL49_9HEXA